MEVVIPVVLQLISGAAGGYVLGQIATSVSLGSLRNSIAGGLGGVAGSCLAAHSPGLDTLVSAAASPNGAMDPGALAGQVAVALVSGGVVTACAGFIKSGMAKA